MHNKSLSLSEMEESVKKFYPDASMIYNAGCRLTPIGLKKVHISANVSELDAGEGQKKSPLKEGLKQALEESMEELHKVASEAIVGVGKTNHKQSSSDLGKSEIIK